MEELDDKMKGIILHGGHGTRLRPLTHTGPKQLLPIANKPMSEYCIESLKDAGITEIAIVIGGIGANKVKEYYNSGDKLGVTISYIEQDEPKGIAHAILLCKNFIGNEKFVVFLGDNIMTESIKDISKKFIESSSDAFLLLCEVDNPQQFGVAEINDGKIIKIIEKPKNPASDLAVTGIYFFTSDIFDILETLRPSWRNELEIVDALQILIDNNKEIGFKIISEFWKDTGTPKDVINANTTLLEKIVVDSKNDETYNCEIIGNVSIGGGSKISNDTKIIGPVLIGKNCIIRKHSIIGPNATIGNDCKLEQCEIVNSIIMSNCSIQINKKIINSIISTNSNVSQNHEKYDEATFLLGEGTNLTL